MVAENADYMVTEVDDDYYTDGNIEVVQVSEDVVNQPENAVGNANTDAGADAGAGADADAGEDADAGTGADTGADANTVADANTDADANAGKEETCDKPPDVNQPSVSPEADSVSASAATFVPEPQQPGVVNASNSVAARIGSADGSGALVMAMVICLCLGFFMVAIRCLFARYRRSKAVQKKASRMQKIREMSFEQCLKSLGLANQAQQADLWWAIDFNSSSSSKTCETLQLL